MSDTSAPALPNDVAGAVSNDAVLDWLRQYQTQRRKVDEENGVLRNIVKRAKADGVNVKALIATHAASKLDPETVRQDLKDQIRYMALKRLPVSREHLFDGWEAMVTERTRQEDDIWDIEEQGYRSGRHGAKIEDCPYPPGSEFAAHWIDWWHKGQAAIARELGPDAKPASASRERPRRGRQARIPGTEPKMAKPKPAKPRAVRRPKANGARGRGRAKVSAEAPPAAH